MLERVRDRRRPTPMTESDETTPTSWEDLAQIGKYPTLETAQEHGLVILAMRQPCWIAETEPPGAYILHAEPAAAPAIQREIEAYEAEQQAAPSGPPADREAFLHPAGWSVFGIWGLLLLLGFLSQTADLSLTARFSSSSTGLFTQGEWWRPFTALFLHADAAHLIGNLLSGMFFGTLVARSIGALRAWTLILACGTMGNAITSAIAWPEAFTSIGASTAVFGALGILSGLGFAAMLRHRFHLSWAKTAAPILAGIVLLGLFGGGSPQGNTDVLGHIFGFTSGLTVGILIGVFSPTRSDSRTTRSASE
jgi:rhomboid protease GluP